MTSLFPPRESLVSYIPAWDRKLAYLFLQCMGEEGNVNQKMKKQNDKNLVDMRTSKQMEKRDKRKRGPCEAEGKETKRPMYGKRETSVLKKEGQKAKRKT